MNSEELKEIQKMIREGIALGLKDVELRGYIGHRTHLDCAASDKCKPKVHDSYGEASL